VRLHVPEGLVHDLAVLQAGSLLSKLDRLVRMVPGTFLIETLYPASSARSIAGRSHGANRLSHSVGGRRDPHSLSCLF
jgi:hypothetical protein